MSRRLVCVNANVNVNDALSQFKLIRDNNKYNGDDNKYNKSVNKKSNIMHHLSNSQNLSSLVYSSKLSKPMQSFERSTPILLSKQSKPVLPSRLFKPFRPSKPSELSKSPISAKIHNPAANIDCPCPSRTYKMVMIGDTGVGKSCLALRFTKLPFQERLPETIGACFHTKNYYNKNDNIINKFQIWDTAGQERYRSMMPIYYRRANIIVAVYSITARKSYDACYNWVMDAISQINGRAVDSMSSLYDICQSIPIVILIGNKIDQNYIRRVSYEDGILLQNRIEKDIPGVKISFYEMSAKITEEFEIIFSNLSMVLRNHPNMSGSLYNDREINSARSVSFVGLNTKYNEINQDGRKKNSCC